MRAAVFHRHGEPEVIAVEEWPVPEPGPFDLLVEVIASSMNPVDTKVRRGVSRVRTLPFIAGYDASGIVRACGASVLGFAVGDEVYGCPNLFKLGAHAEFALLDARAAAHKPQSLDHRAAACVPLVALTAWEALHERARIEPGQAILIHAGAGGVGHLAVQLAKLHGCRVITTAGRAESIGFCRDELRCDEVIDYRAGDFVTRALELTQGRGVPVVIDTVGGETFRKSIECIAPLGQLVTILGSDPGDQAALLLGRAITVHYEFMGARVGYGIQPERQASILRGIARLIDAGALRPHVSAEVTLETVAAGHRQLETGRTIGKIGVRVRG